MKEDYRVDPRNIHVDQRKKDTRRDAWDRDHILENMENSVPKSNRRISNAAPVFVFAFFYICILIMIDSIKWNLIILSTKKLKSRIFISSFSKNPY